MGYPKIDCLSAKPNLFLNTLKSWELLLLAEKEISVPMGEGEEESKEEENIQSTVQLFLLIEAKINSLCEVQILLTFSLSILKFLDLRLEKINAIRETASRIGLCGSRVYIPNFCQAKHLQMKSEVSTST